MQETNAVHMTLKQGSYLEFTLPWEVTQDGYTTRVTGQLFHLDASTSLPFRSFLESEILGVRVGILSTLLEALVQYNPFFLSQVPQQVVILQC